MIERNRKDRKTPLNNINISKSILTKHKNKHISLHGGKTPNPSEIVKFHRQNTLQRGVNALILPISKLYNKINTYFYPKIINLDTYKPKLNKIRLLIGFTLILMCLLTPFTNLLILPLMRFILK